MCKLDYDDSAAILHQRYVYESHDHHSTKTDALADQTNQSHVLLHIMMKSSDMLIGHCIHGQQSTDRLPTYGRLMTGRQDLSMIEFAAEENLDEQTFDQDDN